MPKITYNDLKFGIMDFTEKQLAQLLNDKGVHLDADKIKFLKTLHDKMEALYVYSLLTDSEIVKARKRLVRMINREIRYGQ